jgi:hypothetical protein
LIAINKLDTNPELTGYNEWTSRNAAVIPSLWSNPGCVAALRKLLE